MSGVFQVDRDIFKNSIWSNVTEFRIFLYILGNAVWKEEGIYIGGIHIKRGQYLRSYRNLREDLSYMENNAVKHYSLSNIKKTIDKLITDGRLKKDDTELGTLFTVYNYELYQGFERFGKENKTDTENAERTRRERRENNKKKDNKDNNIYILSQDEKDFIEILSQIENYPLDRVKDLEMYRTLKKRYTELDLLDALEQWRVYKLDKPLEKKSNPRSQINTAFRKYLEWGKCIKSDKTIEVPVRQNWRGSDRRL